MIDRNTINYKMAAILLRNNQKEPSPLRDLDEFFSEINDKISGFFKKLFTKPEEGDSKSKSSDSRSGSFSEETK